MAHMSQERKKELAPAIQSILKEYGIKGTLGVNNHSTLVLNIREGEIDFFNSFKEGGIPDDWKEHIKNVKYLSVNQYNLESTYTGKALEFLNKIVDAMNIGNHNNSDITTDYFDVGWYISINIGTYDKAYKFTG